MSARQRLPNRRGSATFNLEVGGLTFTATASKFADGSLGEVFIQNHKADSTAGVMANDASIAASLALQYGCPLDTLRKALKRDGREHALGPLGVALDMLSTERKDDSPVRSRPRHSWRRERRKGGVGCGNQSGRQNPNCHRDAEQARF